MEMEEAVRWERYIPRRVVRVLVVEPDVSTRNVISALLRNCNYKVSSVSDGLEAWEVLKEKPNSIDLVLTEVDLLSISGFTLLALLMDHDVFKRIPVIMMSSQDSISMVLKCVLKGAADFLIKPIRKNELKNIWQHLWRRQISVEENKHLSTIEEYQKLGGTSENPAVGSPSSARLSSEQEEVECKEMKIIAKMEVEDRMDERRTNSNFDEECVKINLTSADCGREMLGSGIRSLDALRIFDDGAIVKRAKLNDSDSEEPKFQREERIDAFELPGSGRDALFREPISFATIDLLDSIGAGKGESETSKSIVGKSNSACGLQLELWLQGSVPSISRTNEPDGGCLLNHSSASAFSRYNSRNGFGCSLPSYSMIHSKEQRTVNECKEPHLGCIQQQSFLRNSGDDCTAVIDGQSEKVKNTFASTLELVLPRERSRNSNVVSECHDPTLDAHSCQTLSWSTSITGRTDKSVIQLSNSRASELHKCTSADNINAERTIDKHERESDSVMEDYLGPGDVAFGSLMHDRTNGSIMCKEINENTVTAKLVDNSAGFRSATAPGSKKDICGGPNQTDNFHLSAREAALIKFRQKRKERCFEKKVRYHSRKQLAEQRPRIKGQFVRQTQADSASSAS